MSYYWNEFIKDIQSNILPDQVVFDAGAGDCHWKKYFPPEVKYVGMDLGVGDSQTDYSDLDIKGDLRYIPLANSSVDLIICIQVLEHLPEPWNVLAEFNRVLKPSGKLFITCPQGEPQHQVPYDFFRYTPFGLRSLLEAKGFEVIWIKPQFGNFHKVGKDLTYSARKLSQLKNNGFKKFFLVSLSIYLRAWWRIHRALLEYFDKYEQLQDNPTGHFLLARKI